MFSLKISQLLIILMLFFTLFLIQQLFKLAIKVDQEIEE